MHEVILTVGPRASGKSEFCRRAMLVDPSIALVSRDQILIEMFGSTSLSPYTGGHYYAQAQMWRLVEEGLRANAEARMILDAWNGSSEERVNMIRKLRNLNADRIRAWYFVTPMRYVDRWFWRKPGIAKMSEMNDRRGKGFVFYDEDAPRRDYQLFHQLAAGINSDGFDEVVRINPLITTPQQALLYQAPLILEVET